MGKQIPESVSFNLPNGTPVTIETGKLATQAHGSVVVRVGDTMLFASAVSAYEQREGQSFFPLSVDYQEKFAAAGRIPGNFFKREARLSDYEILISRLVDRAIRPLFPDGYMNDTQIIINLISGEEEILPDAYAALAASAAMVASDIPFSGPISEVRVAQIDGELQINPTRSELKKATLDIIVAASLENVMMVEGEANECSEQELVEAIRFGHEAIKVQCNAQLELAKLVGDKAIKREVAEREENEELKAEIKSMIEDKVLEVAKGALDKKSRKKQFQQISDDFKEAILEAKGEEFVAENGALIGRYFDKIKKETIREMVMSEQTRLDGRRPDEVRPIWTEIDYLPSTHGSAIFNRGETQSLTSLTLGTKLDEQMIDTAMEKSFEKFILHYNFPALSVGETKPMRGPGRREVGHANLAARSLKQVLPENSPYTIRLVSDILESNGSSSMATVCAGSLALMDGGIPIKAAVSGVAMGMISDGDRAVILTDILGDEDALGDMDFKVTGTDKGICACQMDIKIEGLSYDLLEKALMQAKDGRIHILGEMNKTIEAAREDYKPHAPRIVEFRIDKSFIGAVIGPGGKVIQEIQKETGAVINISEDETHGIVNVASANKESLDAAVSWVKSITTVPEVGEEYEATVASVQAYGAFVDFLPGKSGLLHVSEISYSRIDNVEDVLSVGDKIKVKLIGIDSRSGKFRLSRKVLLPKPEGYVERERTDRGERRDRGDRRNNRRDNRR